MFTNFIYFIVALLIFTTYKPSQDKQFGSFETFLLFLLISFLFALFTYLQFARLRKRLSDSTFSAVEYRFDVAVSRHSIMAVAIYAAGIYALNLPSFFYDHPLFAAAPTLLALIFLLLFIGYLSIVWAFAHNLYTRLYHVKIGKAEYIFSNISFSIPVILPWLFLSGISDLIFFLPFEFPKRILSSTQGEIAYFFIFLIAIAVLGPYIIQLFWRCKPLEPGLFRNRIEALCEKTDLKYADILHWPLFGGRMITAGVMGLVRRFRYILVTDALLQHLEPQELDAVISHEIGHIKKNHLLFYLFFFAGYLLLSYATFDLIIYVLIYAEPVYRFLEEAGIAGGSIHSAVFSFIIIAVFLFYFRFVFGYFMRNFERQADAYVYTVLKSGQPLISTLEKIAGTSGQPMDKPNWHHFSIRDRIDYLIKCESDKRWITRQDRKIKKSIAVYLSFIIIIAGIGYHINFGQAGKRLSTRLFEKILNQEIEKNPKNANLYGVLGDVYYNSHRYPEAARAYETSIALKPDNPRVLNNLAWLYATSEDEFIRNPERAVRLAGRALSYEQSPHIWDTLAQSLYETGRTEEAVDAAQRALDLAKGDRAYYEEQLKKFFAAAKVGGI